MLNRGPFILKWGDNELSDIDDIKVDYKVDTDDVKTVQGKTYTVDGSHQVMVTLELLATDIGALALLLPQYFVPDGGKLSTGETVNDAVGAIDVVPQDCDLPIIYNNFDIIACGAPGQTMRVVHARTQIDGVTNDDKLRKVTINIIGESDEDEATIQFFNNGKIATVS